jgi:prepilin-type N-terminal cleavage/methylation domain-containing protein
MSLTMRGSRKGFTIIELVISLSIFLLVLMAIYQIFDRSNATYNSGTRKQDIQQQARLAMDEMVKRIRVTGYYSENFDANAANDLANPLSIHIATPTALAVFGDLDGTAQIVPTPALPWSKVFLFCRSNTALLAKTGNSGVAGSYACSCTGTQTGCFLADNVTDLRFRYYDVNNNEIVGNGAQGQLDGQDVGAAVPNLSTGATRAQRGAVRRVIIKFQATETVTNQKDQVYTVTSSIQFRNPNTN